MSKQLLDACEAAIVRLRGGLDAANWKAAHALEKAVAEFKTVTRENDGTVTRETCVTSGADGAADRIRARMNVDWPL